jgi:peroxiredoxin
MGMAKRITFVIDRQGKITKVFPDVNPAGHANEILAALSVQRT